MSSFQTKILPILTLSLTPHFSPILTLYSQRKKKKSNFADKAKIRKNFFP